MKFWRFIFNVFTIIPFAFILSILSFYFHAGLILGRLPRYAHPDPNKLDIYTYYSPFVDWSFWIFLFSFPVWILLTIVYLIIQRKNIKWKLILISGIGQSIGIAIFLSGIFMWYID